MDITITEKKEQPLLSRQEVIGRLTFSGKTPSRDEFRKALAKKLNSKEELLVIKKIDMIFGNQAAYFNAMAYKKKEDMNMIETKPILKRNFEPKEKKSKEEEKLAEEAPKEKKEKAPKEEAKPEEKKEEDAENSKEEPKTESKKDSESTKAKPLSAKDESLSTSLKMKKAEEKPEEKKE